MKALKFSIIALLASLSISVFAGPNDGGGGQGVVCLNPDKTVKSVELLDLWEAREIYKREIETSSEPTAVQVAHAIERLRNVVDYPYGIVRADNVRLSKGDALVDSLRMTAEQFLNPNYALLRYKSNRLVKTKDAYEEIVPDDENCSIEQLVRYKDAGMGGGSSQIMVNERLIDLMDNTNRAALIVHEALYAELRKFGELTSIRTRRAVGLVMSGNSFKPLEMWTSKSHILCESESDFSMADSKHKTKIYFVKNSRGWISTLPVQVNGVLVAGFDDPNSGEPTTLEKFFKNLKTGTGGQGIGLTSSQIDFDLSGYLEFQMNAKVKFGLVYSASGVAQATKNLTCRLIKK